MNKYFHLLLSIMLVQGCVGISQPIASRQLVEGEPVTDNKAIPQTVWGHLSSAKSGEQIQIHSNKFVLGSRFFSAAGKNCRELKEVDLRMFIACKENDSEGWYLVKPILSDHQQTVDSYGSSR